MAGCAVLPYREPKPEAPHATVQVSVAHPKAFDGYVWRDIMRVDKRRLGTPRPAPTQSWKQRYRMPPGKHLWKLQVAHAQYRTVLELPSLQSRKCAGPRCQNDGPSMSLQQRADILCDSKLSTPLRAGGDYFEVTRSGCEATCTRRTDEGTGPCS